METWRTDGGRVSRGALLTLLLHLTRDIRDDTMVWMSRDHVSQIEVEGIAGTAGSASQFSPAELIDTT